jgi:predicted ATPase
MRCGWLVAKGDQGFFPACRELFQLRTLCRRHRAEEGYGGKSATCPVTRRVFHGLAESRFGYGRGIYILDEPEAALSMQRQFEFLKIIRELELQGESQFHHRDAFAHHHGLSGAQLLLFDGKVVRECR